MNYNESVISYNTRVEEIFQKLINSLTSGESLTDSQTIIRVTQKQALTNYIRGLTKELQCKVEIKNPTDLNGAFSLALTAEKEIITNKALHDMSLSQERIINNNYRNNNRNFRQNNNNNFRNRQNNNNNNVYNNAQQLNPQHNGDNDVYNNTQLINPRNNDNYRTNGQRNNTNRPRCYTCNKIGHYSRECRSRAPTANRNN